MADERFMLSLQSMLMARAHGADMLLRAHPTRDAHWLAHPISQAGEEFLEKYGEPDGMEEGWHLINDTEGDGGCWQGCFTDCLLENFGLTYWDCDNDEHARITRYDR